MFQFIQAKGSIDFNHIAVVLLELFDVHAHIVDPVTYQLELPADCGNGHTILHSNRSFHQN